MDAREIQIERKAGELSEAQTRAAETANTDGKRVLINNKPFAG